MSFNSYAIQPTHFQQFQRIRSSYTYVIACVDACMHTYTYIHTYYTYIHAYMQMQIILLPLSGHAHLAEPGCLCTKQALGACASKLLENGLGTRRRTSYLLTASGVGTRSPTWTTAVERKGAVICTQVPIHSWVDWWGWWEAGEEDWTISICEWWGSNP